MRSGCRIVSVSGRLAGGLGATWWRSRPSGRGGSRRRRGGGVIAERRIFENGCLACAKGSLVPHDEAVRLGLLEPDPPAPSWAELFSQAGGGRRSSEDAGPSVAEQVEEPPAPVVKLPAGRTGARRARRRGR